MPELNDPLLSKAEMLVSAASINAVSMFVPLLDKFPSLRKVETAQWDIILTVAGVFMAVTRLRNLRLEQAREDKLTTIVSERFHEWNPSNSRGAFDNCKAFFDKNFDELTKAGHPSQFVASDAIGFWITWNVFGALSNTDEERKFVRTVGAMITHTFFNWWVDKSE